MSNTVIAQPDLRARLSTFGIEPVGGTPQQMAQMVAEDLAKWKRIIVERKISND